MQCICLRLGQYNKVFDGTDTLFSLFFFLSVLANDFEGQMDYLEQFGSSSVSRGYKSE